ncbi:hypothetical protein HEP81_04711 [Streptomyces griseofuscus]|uniref:Uncharacterized protein n=1 Tax=Streptomyces griseofuscus TaxID=146922 RepID=A0A7H1Q3V3_9ACTN|nr:hypothetical protein [Streptomyces griseofuscus]QNT94983.1 hypothetical protein HEP81_04711 [Streptomyces griseofuscus]
MTTATHPPQEFRGLPPAPPGIVPYIAGYSLERAEKPRLIEHPRGGLAYQDETPHDRDPWGTLWVRPPIVPRRARGRPLLKTVHAYRQRRVMRDMLCQVCTQPPAVPEGPYLFIGHSAAGPIREGELTPSPPVCVPCAGISVQLCRPLQHGRWTAAWVEYPGLWGVIGDTYAPGTLDLVDQGCRIQADTREARWTVASMSVVQLHGVTPADLDAEWAALGRERLEAEFARVAELAA